MLLYYNLVSLMSQFRLKLQTPKQIHLKDIGFLRILNINFIASSGLGT